MTHDIRAGGGSRRLLGAAKRFVVATTLLAALSLGAACNNDDGGNSITEVCMELTPAAQPAPGTVSSRMSEDPACSLIEIEIVATDVNDVFAFQSVVNYDPSVAAFLGFSVVDSALESAGVDVTVIAEEQVFGEVTIGVTRVGSADGVDISGPPQVLLKLAFARVGGSGSSGAFALDAQCLLDSGTPPQPLDAACSGGTFVVR